jgi:diguanylate cyclase (GGDEF)-like protein
MAIRELVALEAMGATESEWENRLRRALAFTPPGLLPSFYVLRSRAAQEVVLLGENSDPPGFSAREVAARLIEQDSCAAIPLERCVSLCASAPSGVATLTASNWVWPVRGNEQLLGFWIGGVGLDSNPHVQALLEELNHWIVVSRELADTSRTEPAHGSAEPAPLARWLAADSLMSLCTLAFSDFRDVHGFSRLLIVAHAGGWPLGWALTPWDEHVRFVDDWFAARAHDPLASQQRIPPACPTRSARLPEIDVALQKAGFHAGASIETGRSTSYCVFWGRTSAATGQACHAPSANDADDRVTDGFLWPQLQVALRNMARLEYLRELSHIDSITRVFNRRYFNLRLTEETSRARRSQRPLSLLVFDIDHFKDLNDSLGHQAGDSILRRLAEYVRWTVRSTDLFCRLSGDEFAILMPDNDTDDCMGSGERLLASLSDRRFTAGKGSMAVPVGISIGGAVFPRHAENAESLLWCADMALLAAKQRGRGRFVLYDPSLSSSADAQ